MKIKTLGDLMRAIATANFGGYDASFDVSIRNEHSTLVDSFKGGGFLIIDVTPSSDSSEYVVTDYVGCSIFGEWWFDANDRVMQQL